MLLTITKIAVVYIVTLTTISHRTPDRRYSRLTLAAVDTVSQADTNAANHKNTDYKKSGDVNTFYKKSSAPSKKITRQSPGRIKVSGYHGQTFVYGELLSRKDGKLEGFIYHPNNRKTYVYGEKVNEKISLYDSSGNFYQLLREN